MEADRKNIISLGENCEINLTTHELLYSDAPAKKVSFDTLPVIDIEGTDFMVDVYSGAFIEKGNPRNFFQSWNLEYDKNGYYMWYHPEYKTPAVDVLPSHECVRVEIPPFIQLDPRRMAEKYGVEQSSLKDKTDFDIIVDQQAFENRLKNGRLPTLDIEGVTFLVDLERGILAEKNGAGKIDFEEIRPYYNFLTGLYIVPYDTESRSPFFMNGSDIGDQPEGIKVISFPHEMVLDRVGWNLSHHYPPGHGLMDSVYRLDFTAGKGAWQEAAKLRQDWVDDFPLPNKKTSPKVELSAKKTSRRRRGIS